MRALCVSHAHNWRGLGNLIRLPFAWALKLALSMPLTTPLICFVTCFSLTHWAETKQFAKGSGRVRTRHRVLTLSIPLTTPLICFVTCFIWTADSTRDATASMRDASRR